LSDFYIPTLGRSVPIYNYLIDLIEDFLELQHPEDICSAAEKAKDKLQKFYPTSDGLVYIVATIMDPRLKMQYYIDNEFDDYIEMYKEKISDLWKMEYMPIQECNTTIQTTKTPNTLESHILKRRKNIQTDELDMYLNSPPLNFDTDVLSFWKNTNLYAYKKNTESDQKDWNDLTLNELKIWLALVIYMGIFKLPAIKDYWVIDSYYPSHEVIKMMTIKRFNELGISQEHKKFRIQIVKELIKEATQNPLKRNTRNGENGETSEKKNDNKRFRVSDIFELPATRLI
ncbi:14314_t:CDS:2, partial [Entrophospora sp. SA101]